MNYYASLLRLFPFVVAAARASILKPKDYDKAGVVGASKTRMTATQTRSGRTGPEVAARTPADCTSCVAILGLTRVYASA